MPTPYDRPYAHTRRFDRPLSEVVTSVREALGKEGFGVLTEIDVQATLKKKISVDRRPYLILGACNPKLANDALNVDEGVGVFLPCNVDVFEGEDGGTYVQTIRPEVMFGIINSPGISPIAAEVDQRLRRVLDAI